MAAIAMEEVKELACVMIPVATTHVLLPNVSVAEILPWRRMKSWSESPAWCIGLLGWRGETIPVVQYDVINGSTEVASESGRCLLVMNRARISAGLPFYGLVAEGLPRLVHLASDDILNQPVKLGAAEVASVRVGTELAVVPNLSYIEEQLAKLPKLP